MRLSVLCLALLSAAPIAAQSIVSSWSVPPTGTAFPGGVAYDPLTDTIWIVDETADRVRQFDRQGAVKLDQPAPIPSGSGITDPNPIGCCYDASTGNLWVVTDGPIRWCYELKPDGVTIGRAFSIQALFDASGVTIDPASGTLWIADDSAAALFEFKTDGMLLGSISLSGAGITDPDGVAYDPASRTFFVADDLSDTIFQVDRTGKKINEWSLATLGISPEGIDLDVRNMTVFVGDAGTQRRLVELSGILGACKGTALEFGPRTCKDSGGNALGLVASSCPAINTTLVMSLQASSTVTTPATFLIGTQRAQLDLAFMTMRPNECFLFATPIIVLTGIPLTGGRANVPLVIPDDPTLSGVQLDVQGVLYPHSGVPGSIATSNGLELTIR